jgi:hypothetical protein
VRLDTAHGLLEFEYRSPRRAGKLLQPLQRLDNCLKHFRITAPTAQFLFFYFFFRPV